MQSWVLMNSPDWWVGGGSIKNTLLWLASGPPCFIYSCYMVVIFLIQLYITFTAYCAPNTCTVLSKLTSYSTQLLTEYSWNNSLQSCAEVVIGGFETGSVSWDSFSHKWCQNGEGGSRQYILTKKNSLCLWKIYNKYEITNKQKLKEEALPLEL